jgi:AcrR family transcriptional regulator
MARAPKPPPLRPRKAPRQPRSEHTVAALLEAAAQVLEQDGMEGFNTNAVAQRAGVGIGSLYQYFPGKESLILALMRREDERFDAEALMALSQPTAADALKSFVAACVRQQLLRPNLARLLDVEQARPEFRKEASSSMTLQAILLATVERTDLPTQARPDVAARDLLAIIRGMTDAAGARGEVDIADLQRRIEPAVFGYLHMAPDQA